MAFPTITSPTVTTISSATPSINVAMPSSTTAGRLILVFLAMRYPATWTLPSGWSEYTPGQDSGGVGELTVLRKTADGTEGGTTVTFTSSVNNVGVAHVREVDNWDSTTTPELVTTSSGGSPGSNANPPSITPSWGAEDNLIIAIAAAAAEVVTGDVPLDSHIPDTGTGWTKRWQGSELAVLKIPTTNNLAPQVNVVNQGVVYAADATYPSADYSVEVTIGAGFTSTNRCYLIVRMVDDDNMYALRFTTGGTGTRVYKKIAGSWIATGGALQADPTVGDVVKLEIIGDQLSFYYNGVVKDTSTQTQITGTGQAGLAVGGGSDLVSSTDDILATSRLDDFTVTDNTSGVVFDDNFTYDSSEVHPPFYEDGLYTSYSGGGASASLGTAVREVNAASEDPNAWATTTSRWWMAGTLAIRPSAGGGGTTTDEDFNFNVTGKDTANSNSNFNLVGSDTATADTLFNLTGKDMLSGSFGFNLIGKDTANSDSLFNLAGEDTTSYDVNFGLVGQNTITGDMNFNLSGLGIADHDIGFGLVGNNPITGGTTSLNAYAIAYYGQAYYGQGTLDLVTSETYDIGFGLVGKDTENYDVNFGLVGSASGGPTDISFNLWGSDQISGDMNFNLVGFDTASYDSNFNLVGTEATSHTFDFNLYGIATTTHDVNFGLTGVGRPSHEVDFNLHGKDTEDYDMNFGLRGGLEASHEFGFKMKVLMWYKTPRPTPTNWDKEERPADTTWDKEERVVDTDWEKEARPENTIWTKGTKPTTIWTKGERT